MQTQRSVLTCADAVQKVCMYTQILCALLKCADAVHAYADSACIVEVCWRCACIVYTQVLRALLKCAVAVHVQ